MTREEAAFFYNCFDELFQELRELELSENFDNTDIAEEIST